MNSIICAIKADLINGIWKRRYYLLPVILFSTIISFTFIKSITTYFTLIGNPKSISYIECIMNLFKGMKEYIPSENKTFDLPIVFIIINVYLALLIGDYAVRDTKEYGLWMLIKAGNKRYWWIAKCIWNIATVVLFYIALFIGTMTGWLLGGKGIGGIVRLDEDVVSYVLQDNSMSFQMLMRFFLLQILISFALSLFQTTLSLFTNPLISYGIIASYFVASSYCMSNWLLGNFCMLIRFPYMNVVAGVFIAIGLLLISGVGGYVMFMRRDLI